MKICSHCSQAYKDELTLCPFCNPGTSGETTTYVDYNPNDFPKTFMCILSFLFPIVGIIYYIFNYRREIISCNTYLKWALLPDLILVGLYMVGKLYVLVLNL